MNERSLPDEQVFYAAAMITINKKNGHITAVKIFEDFGRKPGDPPLALEKYPDVKIHIGPPESGVKNGTALI
jgi:hypothetical protein